MVVRVINPGLSTTVQDLGRPGYFHLGIPLGAQNNWTRALAQAAVGGQKGTVVLLASVGMQTRDWRGVPAAHLFHIVRALNRVGMEYEARMIAAEAIARL